MVIENKEINIRETNEMHLKEKDELSEKLSSLNNKYSEACNELKNEKLQISSITNVRNVSSYKNA